MSAGPLAGVAMMMVGMLLLPVGDAIAKHLATITDYGPATLAWSRFVVGSAVLVPAAYLLGAFRGLGLKFLGQQAVRGALVGGAITFIIKGLQTVSLADAFGAFFVGPALATVLASAVLRERVKPIEWVAVTLGFAGVALVVKPSMTMSIGVLWALAGGACYGAFLVATRWAAGSAPSIAQLAGQLFFGLLVLAPFGAGDIVRHGIQAPFGLLAMGATSAIANLLSIMALARAGAAYLAPVVYVQIISASAITWLVFGDTIDALALVGLSLIVCAGITRIPFRAFLGRA